MTTPSPHGPTMWWQLDASEAARLLDGDLTLGLSEAEAVRRLERAGPNVLSAVPPPSPWRRLLRQFTDPLVVLLLVAIVISLIAWWADGSDGTPLDALVITVIVVLNAVIGSWQEAKAVNAVAALRRLSSARSSVLRDGTVRQIETSELVVGDVIALAEGDAVGADCRLISTAALRIAEASLTGESVPVTKDVATIAETVALAERLNMAYSGTAVVGGRGQGLVVATAMATEIGRIATLLDDHQEEPTPLQQQISWLGRRLGAAVVVLSAVVVAALLLTADDHSPRAVVEALLVGVSLAVAAVPEGLPAILSVVLALGVQRMAGQAAIVKRLSSVETLGSASVICTDKTGTLTRNEMTVTRIATATGIVDLDGVGYEPIGDASVDGRPADPQLRSAAALVVSAGSLASNASLSETEPGGWDVRGDPTEIALLVAEEKLGAASRRQQRFDRLAEIPFDSERRRMTTVNADRDTGRGGPHLLVTKGAPDEVLDRCSHERVGDDHVPLTPARRAEIARTVDRLAGEALRTISVASRRLDAVPDPLDQRAERELTHLGIVGIHDPPRQEAAESIAEAHRAGIRVVMITGDHPVTASCIGRTLGLTDGRDRAVTGQQLGELGGRFDEVVQSTSVFARVEPVHKLRIVESLQANGQVVAMTGDGVNDAPALRRADIGVAMGLTGAEVSKEAADMILADDNVATILRAVREGREILADIRKVLRYLLASNTGEVLVVLIGVLAAAWLGLDAVGGEPAVPLLATQILWINLLTDGALAIALGVDPAVEDVMTEPPRRSDERVVDRHMLVTIALLGLTSAVAALVALDLRLPGGIVGDGGDIDTARTMAFSTLVFAQIFNAFNARSDRVSAFVRPFENLVLWGSVGVTVGLQVAAVHWRALGSAFGTAPLDAGEWLIVLGLASTVLWVDELRKVVVHRSGPKVTQVGTLGPTGEFE